MEFAIGFLILLVVLLFFSLDSIGKEKTELEKGYKKKAFDMKLDYESSLSKRDREWGEVLDKQKKKAKKELKDKIEAEQKKWNNATNERLEEQKQAMLKERKQKLKKISDEFNLEKESLEKKIKALSSELNQLKTFLTENDSSDLQENLEPEDTTTQPEKIKYVPVLTFDQVAPYSYPITIMPSQNCVIKFPRKGKKGRKGYTEHLLVNLLKKVFDSDLLTIWDDGFITVKNQGHYEPDVILFIKEHNLFIDIEIDEPYIGTNDIENREPIHYHGVDTIRNIAFAKRGWITIRFAEIQVFKNPGGCCLHIANVLKAVLPKINISDIILDFRNLSSIEQWSREQAKTWSLGKYREQYLKIDSFGKTEDEFLHGDLSPVSTPSDDAVEELIDDDNTIFTFDGKNGHDSNGVQKKLPEYELYVLKNGYVSLDEYLCIREAINMNGYYEAMDDYEDYQDDYDWYDPCTDD